MERLYGVLAEKTDELAGQLAGLRGYEHRVARSFVTVAGADLIHSFAWQASELDTRDLAALPNVTRLLGGMHASRIAQTLGIPVGEVWAGLRTFVPEVLSLASASVPPPSRETAAPRSFYAGPSQNGRAVTSALGPRTG